MAGEHTDDPYALLGFAWECVHAAIRSGDPTIVRRGVEALAAVDGERADPRDVTWVAALLAWTSAHLGVDPAPVLTEVAAVSSPGTAETLKRFAAEPPRGLRAWGYRLVESDGAPALVRDDGREFDATVDLLAIAKAIGGVLEGDAYQGVDVTLGADIPDVWLRNGDPDAVARALADVRAAANVRADAPIEDQMLVAFVAETRTDDSASVLAAAASCFRGGDALGVAAGRVCCVVVGRSVVVGSPAFEKPGALERFREPIGAVIARP